jgi:hypothetical protein
MEEYSKEKLVVELPPVQSVETISPEAEAANVQTDKIKHSSEQSSANISPGLNSVQDSSMALPEVDDSAATDDQATQGFKKIAVVDEATFASDSDRIEKVWVDKAKAIIRDSVGDPHKKSANLSVEKSQYRNARFNKLINTR